MEEETRGQRLRLLSAAKVASVAYIVYGLVDITILAMSGFRMAYIGVLGGLSVATGVGLWSRRRWGLWLSVVVTPLTVCVGIVTLAASVIINGFAVNAKILTLQLSLILYTAVAFILSSHLLTKRRDYH